METLTAWQPRILSILRMVAGLIFFLHGTQKLFSFPATERVVEAFTLSWFAGVIEVVCGIAILVGFLTRPAAFLASGQMAVAYWMAHAPRDLFPTNNSGDAAILFCFIFLYLVFAGPGPLERRRSNQVEGIGPGAGRFSPGRRGVGGVGGGAAASGVGCWSVKASCSLRRDLGKRLLAAFVVDVTQREFRATFGKGMGQNAAEPLRGPGNQDDFAFEI
ncbi:MAG TPA: DoxX family protein [Phycisphaerae bacterium]|nr:DoxX family protein [Phycisphaerae bacterium]